MPCSTLRAGLQRFPLVNEATDGDHWLAVVMKMQPEVKDILYG